MTVPPGGPPKAVIDSSVLVPILTYQFPSTNWLGYVDKWVFIPSCEGVLQVRYVPTLAHFVRIAFVILLLALAVVSAACGSQPDPTAAPATSAPTTTSAPVPPLSPGRQFQPGHRNQLGHRSRRLRCLRPTHLRLPPVPPLSPGRQSQPGHRNQLGHRSRRLRCLRPTHQPQPIPLSHCQQPRLTQRLHLTQRPRRGLSEHP